MQNSPEMLVLAVATFLPALVFLFLPLWRSGNQLFTIEVSPEFLHSQEAQRLRRTYRTVVLAVGAIACVAMLRFAHPDAPLEITLTPFGEIVALACCWGWAWNSTMPHRVPHAVVRTASLSQQEPSSAGWWLTTLPAVLPLLAAAAYLQLHWSQIPATFATHFGSDGTPNGFTQKSVAGVYWPLVTGVFLVCVMSAMGFVTARFSPGPNPLRRMTTNLLRVICWFMALMFCWTSLLPLMPNAGSNVAWVAGASLLLLVGISVYVVMTLLRDKNLGTLQQSTSEQYWKWGIFYYNPDDGALIVPKRLGFGYTFNFGHPAAWLLVLGILAVGAVSVVFSLHVRTH